MNLLSLLTFAWASIASYRDLTSYAISGESTNLQWSGLSSSITTPTTRTANTSLNKNVDTVADNQLDFEDGSNHIKKRFPKLPFANQVTSIVHSIHSASLRIQQIDRNTSFISPYTKAIVSYAKWPFFWCFFFLTIESGLLILQIQFLLEILYFFDDEASNEALRSQTSSDDDSNFIPTDEASTYKYAAGIFALTIG